MRCLFAVMLALVLAIAAPAAEGARFPGILIGNKVTYFTLHWALIGAADWFSRPACGGLLSEFRDVAGTPLAATLARLGGDPAAYLGQLTFRDGSALAPCRVPTTIMFTNTGARTVFVCEYQFAAMARADRLRINAMVIHEALHSLGLGENPPTSIAITNRVLALCRR